MKPIAQGTIEYLVIIAVVIVLSLIVVGLLITVSSSPSQQIKDSSSKLGSGTSGGITIVEAITDLDGDSLIKLGNNSSDVVYLNKLTLCGGVDNDYVDSRRQLVGLDSKIFSLSGVDCAVGEKSKNCDLKVEYTTLEGLAKVEYKTVVVNCVTNSVPTDPGKVVDPVALVLELGTLANPWIINDCVELQDMNNHLDGNFILGNDIECGVATHSGGVLYNGGLGFSPVGSCGGVLGACTYDGALSFRGNLDGAGHTIRDLYINRSTSNEAALFGYYKGNIDDLHLEDVNIMGMYYVGGIASSIEGSITNSSVSGEVNGYASVGGLAGRLIGTISNCYFEGDVIGLSGTFIGGLLGDIIEISSTELSLMSNCYFSGNVNSSNANYVGGIVGYVTGASIFNSYSRGTVIGADYVGGLVGSYGELNATGSVISNSFSTSSVNVIGGTNAGGLVGETWLASSIFDNSYWDKLSTTKANCYITYDIDSNPIPSDDGCLFTNDISNYYFSDNAPLSSWTWGVDKNWMVVTGNYPILSWQ